MIPAHKSAQCAHGPSNEAPGEVKEARATNDVNLIIPHKLPNKETVEQLTVKVSLDARAAYTSNVSPNECPTANNALPKSIENASRMVKMVK